MKYPAGPENVFKLKTGHLTVPALSFGINLNSGKLCLKLSF